MTNKDKVVMALTALGGHAFLKDIYSMFEKISSNNGEIIAQSYKAIIRDVLEENSSDSSKFKGKVDLFYSVDGLGNGHWGLRCYDSNDHIEHTQDDDAYHEGKLVIKEHIKRERNPLLIKAAKNRFLAKHGKLYCEICGFDFKEKYGDLGDGFIEAHHIKPISKMTNGETTKVEDIVMLCSNCHSMIHRYKKTIDHNNLKNIIK